jgi:acetyl-CoA C-acetyltransferase
MAAPLARHAVPDKVRDGRIRRNFAETTMTDAFIYDHLRSPRGRGKVDGSLHEVSTVNLGSQVLKGLRERNNLDPMLVDDVVMGCVDPVGEAGGDVARISALIAGYGDHVPGIQINRFCASGLDAVNFAAAEVMSGQHDMTIGGGVESMSRVGIGASGGAWFMDPMCAIPTYFMPQGVSADLIATKYGFSRDDVDAYAVESQKRAAQSWEEGRFKKSIYPIKDVNGITLLDKDEHMRPSTTMQSLASLKPSFAEMGQMGGYDAVATQRYPEVEEVIHVHHAGNSSGIVDGAAGVLIGNKEAGQKAGLKPRARIRAFANIGSEPGIMLTGPVPVTEKVLKKAGMSIADIDLYELNEAFAAVVLRYMQAFDIPHDKINVNGGAIALGHPLGATGAMILGTVLDELERRGKSTALITLCIGAGMGTATIIERV